jgi:GTP cyclohydrolase FolE2
MHDLKYILKIKTQIKIFVILIATDTMYVVIHHSNKGVLLPVLHTTLYTHSEYRDTTLYTLCKKSGRNM